MLHDRLSEAGGTVFNLKERAAEHFCSDHDLEMANFHSNINELSPHLTRLQVYFKNMSHYLSEKTFEYRRPALR